jgi:hypothetical protein
MEHRHQSPASVDVSHGAAPEAPAREVCYHQACPVCGRSLLIRVTLLGRPVYCQHCGGNFIASDNELPRGRDADRRPQSAVVDELIERAAVMLGRGSE